MCLFALENQLEKVINALFHAPEVMPRDLNEARATALEALRIVDEELLFCDAANTVAQGAVVRARAESILTVVGMD